jgi:hypothetical protein
VWETKNRESISVKDMSDSHLENAIKFLLKKEEFEEIAAEYDFI